MLELIFRAIYRIVYIVNVTKFARAEGQALKLKIKKKNEKEKGKNNGLKEERNDSFLCTREKRSF